MLSRNFNTLQKQFHLHFLQLTHPYICHLTGNPVSQCYSEIRQRLQVDRLRSAAQPQNPVFFVNGKNYSPLRHLSLHLALHDSLSFFLQNLVKHGIVEMAESLPVNKYRLCEPYIRHEWVDERDGLSCHWWQESHLY